MCLFLILLAFGPRTAIAIWWPAGARPLEQRCLARSSCRSWVPVHPVDHVDVRPGRAERRALNGLDYLWLGLAIFADIASYSAGGVYGRRRGVSSGVSSA